MARMNYGPRFQNSSIESLYYNPVARFTKPLPKPKPPPSACFRVSRYENGHCVTKRFDSEAMAWEQASADANWTRRKTILRCPDGREFNVHPA